MRNANLVSRVPTNISPREPFFGSVGSRSEPLQLYAYNHSVSQTVSMG